MQKEEQKLEKKINKDLILREKLALQRITLANQTSVSDYLNWIYSLKTRIY
ncbi:MAG: hypothetical protein NW226_01545 [Microscillaceae bacterium]|nr:hypothetical protein [Microscillaceae bacterium]